MKYFVTRKIIGNGSEVESLDKRTDERFTLYQDHLKN